MQHSTIKAHATIDNLRSMKLSLIESKWKKHTLIPYDFSTMMWSWQVVVDSLAKHKVMIILDNHISKPGWCCSSYDGNGFFGDIYFDPKLWVIGLTKVATMFNGSSNVVGMSLRNELRGPKQNVNDWYRYRIKHSSVYLPSLNIYL